MRQLKIIILLISKYIGLFSLSRKLTSNGLRILCYHGFTNSDESLFRPKLFITERLFKQRLEKISKMGFSVISLDKAVSMLESGVVPENSIVITVDDGWLGVESIAWPLLKEYKFDWTLYLTTYYAEKQTQVMNVAIQYLCWKAQKGEYDFSTLEGFNRTIIQLKNEADSDFLTQDLIKFGEQLPNASATQKFVECVADIFNKEQSLFDQSNMFYIIGMKTAGLMSADGVDIQLHTHRHTLGGTSKTALNKELTDNKNSIQKTTEKRLVHFCFPSGYYENMHLSWLKEQGIISATTCKPGLNYSNTPLLELNRFLDGENISAIEFEAELSGFTELLRKSRSFFKMAS